MKSAILALVTLVGMTGPGTSATYAALPEGKIAVVRVTAVDGLAHRSPETQTRTAVYSYDGSEYSIDRTALASLDGVSTLLLIDRQKDVAKGGATTRHSSQEVRAFPGTAFEVADLKGKVLAYQVAMIGGNLRLLGDGDQILAMAGGDGPYQVWRVEGIDLVDRSAVVLR